MYRKEEILSLLKDPNDPEADIENDPSHKPMLKWHKVGICVYYVSHAQRQGFSRMFNYVLVSFR